MQDQANEVSGPPQGIGKATSKAQRDLDALNANEAARLIIVNETRKRLEATIKKQASDEKRKTREERRELERHVALRLGRMILATLIERNGVSGTLLTSGDLAVWSERHLAELEALIASPTDSVSAVAVGEAPSPTSVIDVDLDLDVEAALTEGNDDIGRETS